MLATKPFVGVVLTIATTFLFVGCDSSSSKSGGASMDQMAGAVDAQKSAKQQQDDAAAAAKAAADKKSAEEAAAKPPVEPEKKVVGRAPVAPGGGYYSAIIGARRHILNEAESWAWKQGVGSFRATNGRKPKDNNEFMKQVINAMEIPLPHKEENEEYFYDSAGETDGDYGQLYVIEKQPAPNSGSSPVSAPAKK